MKKHRFYRETKEINGKPTTKWYIDLPKWPGPQAALQMVMGADELLDKLSNDSGEVTLQYSSRKIKDYDDKIDRVGRLKDMDKDFGNFDGAIYSPERTEIEFDELGDNCLWLCGVTLFVFLRYPKTIYFKIVKDGI